MNKSARYWEIDVVRALALLLIMVQHSFVVWNLLEQGVATAPDLAKEIGRVGAVLFLLLVGLSAYILYSKKSKTTKSEELDKQFFIRGLWLMGCGAVVSVVTFFAVPKAPIYFGVLSFIGLSVILLPYLIRNAWLRWGAIFTAPVLGYLFTLVQSTSYALLPFGIYPRPFHSSDYWPIFPWISLVLVGVILGQQLYTDGERQIGIKNASNPFVLVLQWIGSHTLLLYMVHFPVLYVAALGIQYLVKL